MTRSLRLICSLLCALPSFALGQEAGFQDDLLEHKTGTWVMTGTIGGDQITHDLTIEWILAHQYLRIHEVAREKDSAGQPAYEAFVHIGWDPVLKQYACMWLDITGGSGINGQGIGHATRKGNTLPFVFDDGTGSAIHTTFIYEAASDTWKWTIDNVRGEKVSPFARVSLKRRR